MKLLKPLKSQKGFTLVELLAVMAITATLLVVVSAIFIQIVQSNVRATVSNDIRENGQFMMEQLVRAIRNAESINGGVVSGKTLAITVTTGGTAEAYVFTCIGSPLVPSLIKNGQQMNTSKILVSVNCNNSIDTTKSWFEMIPPSPGAPAAVQVNLVLETNSPNAFHREYVGKQTLTQLVTLRTYIR